jgi:LuxR family glucitol operon transcriptional activator
MGLLKYERRPLQQIVDDLYAARGDLFDDLFSRAWALLNEAAKRILMVATFFVDSANSEALAAVADVQGFDFDRAMERLTDLSLLDEQRADLASEPRYTLHPLVRAFTGARLVEQPAFEKEARERWVEWYITITSRVGWCWRNIERLKTFDIEHETIMSTLRWSVQYRLYSEAIELSRGFTFYYLVRGRWDRQIEVERLYFEAASYQLDRDSQVLALSYSLQVLISQGNVEEAEQYLSELEELAQKVKPLSEAYLEYKYTFARYYMIVEDYSSAIRFWEEMCTEGEALDPFRLFGHYYLASCLYHVGDVDKAEDHFQSSLQEAIHIGHQRYICLSNIELAIIDLVKGRLEKSAQRLSESGKQASENKDYEALIKLKHTTARLNVLLGDSITARAYLLETIDLAERLGMRPKLAEAREELARLEAQMAEAAE